MQKILKNPLTKRSINAILIEPPKKRAAFLGYEKRKSFKKERKNLKKFKKALDKAKKMLYNEKVADKGTCLGTSVFEN